MSSPAEEELLEDDDLHEAGREIPHEGTPIDPEAFGSAYTDREDVQRTAAEYLRRKAEFVAACKACADRVDDSRLAPELGLDWITRRVPWATSGTGPHGKVEPMLDQLWRDDTAPFDFAATELVRLDKLPAPSGWEAHALDAGGGCVERTAGYGVGTLLNAVLGGGIGRGEALVLGAAGPGAGKTHLLGQWAEGLALRCAAMLADPRRWDDVTRTLTPVIMLSELSAPAVLGRAVARWTGIDSNAFRQGRHWCGYVTHGSRPIDAITAQRTANAALGASGELAPLRDWMRRLAIRSSSSPRDTVEQVKRAAWTWTQQVRARGLPDGVDVVPLVVVDPIQRYQGAEDDEVKALNVLVEAMHEAAIDEGFAVLCTSDTNKDSSTSGAGKRATNERDARERGAKMLRGSNKLLHLVDASVYLERDWDTQPPAGFGEVELGISKNRYGRGGPPFARFRWHLQSGRMFACTEAYCASQQSKTIDSKKHPTAVGRGDFVDAHEHDDFRT